MYSGGSTRRERDGRVDDLIVRRPGRCSEPDGSSECGRGADVHDLVGLRGSDPCRRQELEMDGHRDRESLRERERE